jgi:hypothetical protein
MSVLSSMPSARNEVRSVVARLVDLGGEVLSIAPMGSRATPSEPLPTA